MAMDADSDRPIAPLKTLRAAMRGDRTNALQWQNGRSMHPLPFTRDLVLIGGGHSHALVLKYWGMKPLAGVRVTVINPGPVAAYSGMLPGFVAGHYPLDALELDLVRLARFAGARLIAGRATHIDTARQEIHVTGRPPIQYDIASIDIGITTGMPDLDGFDTHAIAAKPLEAFAKRWDRFRSDVRAGTVAPEVAVIGGGVAGAELAMATSHALGGQDGAAVSLIDHSEILTELRPAARRRMQAALTHAGVNVLPNSHVTRVTDDCVMLAGGEIIPSTFTLGVAGARPYPWLSEIGLETTEGSITVGPTLQSSDPSIFATGDCAYMRHAPRPKAGVFAVRQAPVLFENLKRVLMAGPKAEKLRAYRPQSDYLKLISLGGKSALADKNGLLLAGPLLWRWKDHIDRKFMAMLKDLPPMAMPALPAEIALGVRDALAGSENMCGACGAKVGGDVLARVLEDTKPIGDTSVRRADVIDLKGDDAAMLTLGNVRQVLSVDHLRGFALDPFVMTTLTATHALGDIWAMGAAPQAALATVTLPRMSPALQDRTLREIMTAARTVFEAAGANVIGGHTSMGAEFSVGFTVTGLVDEGARAPITLAGAQAGDVLILTKPIGSGVILAAEMALKARGADVIAAYTHMAQSSARASEHLSCAHAMTDVTGFGLAGHLTGICRASHVGAEISLGQIPVLSGALALSAQGVRSTIYPSNRAYVPEYDGPEDPHADLLFDPQTAGGLLAAVAPDEADGVLCALKADGYTAAPIGKITGGGVTLTVRP